MRDWWTIVDLLHIKIVIDRPSNIRLPFYGFFFFANSPIFNGTRGSQLGQGVYEIFCDFFGETKWLSVE